jgi:hypothetical protein
MDPTVAFCVREHEDPALEVRVNFGVFAGRHVTNAEIDRLAHSLRDELPSFSVVAEERHEFGGDSEASLHQVVIEVGREQSGGDPSALCDRIVELADAWATDCFETRHLDVSDL